MRQRRHHSSPRAHSPTSWPDCPWAPARWSDGRATETVGARAREPFGIISVFVLVAKLANLVVSVGHRAPVCEPRRGSLYCAAIRTPFAPPPPKVRPAPRPSVILHCVREIVLFHTVCRELEPNLTVSWAVKPSCNHLRLRFYRRWIDDERTFECQT